MRYFRIEFEWFTRPMYRKGRLRTIKLAFGANDQTQAYELAQAEGARRFPRHRWKIIGCEELTVPVRFPQDSSSFSLHHD